MGLVITSKPCAFVTAPAVPARLPTVAKWKVVKKKVKLRPRKTSESAKKHVGCTTHLVLPPPPPQFTIIKEA
ncbi:hypothetical protein WJX81_001691 [Elliptochloris bilobata]|uniref:Uncharacterized protein n=1 Tax=Elliptochloris bilobata TaxID=381761 RepID=A0AAW1S148_9CHLO